MHSHIFLKTGALLAMALATASTSRAEIVNISGTTSGEQSGDDGCASCTGPLISPVQVTFAPGTYTITDAYSTANGLAAGALYDAWNFEAGNDQAWVWHWKALLDDGADGASINDGNYADHILLDIDSLDPQDTFTSEAQAAAFGAATAVSSLTFAATTTVDFVVNDYYLPDNAGGVSLDIVSDAPPAGSVPEPSSWALMIVGIGGIGIALRRAARHAVVRRTPLPVV